MDLIQLFLGTGSMKIVDESNSIQKFENLAVTSVDILSSAVAAEIPIAATSLQVVSVYEDSLISNMQANKIIMPAAMTVNGICSDLSTMENLIESYKDLEATYTITSRSIIANAMAMTSIEMTQDAENISGVTVAITFEQTSIAQGTSFNPMQSADRDVLGIDSKEPEGLTTTATNLYNNIKSKLGI